MQVGGLPPKYDLRRKCARNLGTHIYLFNAMSFVTHEVTKTIKDYKRMVPWT